MGMQKGFSVIELLIYSSLSIFIVVLVLQFLVTFERFVIGRSGAALYMTSLYAGIDSMSRDCASAPANPLLWKSAQPQRIIWQDELGQQGFEFLHNKLVRVSRSIDRNGQMKAPAYSTLLHNVEGLFAVNRSNNLVSSINISLKAQYHDTVVTIDKRVNLHGGLVS